MEAAGSGRDKGGEEERRCPGWSWGDEGIRAQVSVPVPGRCPGQVSDWPGARCREEAVRRGGVCEVGNARLCMRLRGRRRRRISERCCL